LTPTTHKKRSINYGQVRAMVIGVVYGLLAFCQPSKAASAWETQASWYSEASCRREGTSGIMANGRLLDDSKLTCASWDYPFGSKLRITYQDRSCLVEVTDRGPARRLYRSGRKLDLSKAAFQALADLRIGVITVSMEEVK